MNDIEITLSWLVVYGLAGLLGFLGGKVVDKILAAALKRWFLGMDFHKTSKTVSEDAEEQFYLAKKIANKNKFKLTNFDLKKDFKRK